MTDHDIHGCGGTGAWVGVLCAALGVLTAYAMLKAMGIGHFVWSPSSTREITIGLIGLFIAARGLGKKAGVFLCSKGNRLGFNVLAGIGVAFGSITIAVLTGMFVGLVREFGVIVGSPGFEPKNLVLGPLMALALVFFFGGIPALVLGALFGFLVKTRLERLTR